MITITWSLRSIGLGVSTYFCCHVMLSISGAHVRVFGAFKSNQIREPISETSEPIQKTHPEDSLPVESLSVAESA